MKARTIQTMKVVVLGGAGEVGMEVTRDLASCDEIDELVIADIDRGRAERLAVELTSGDGRTPIPVGADVRDRGGMLELLEGANLLMNCTSFELFDDVFVVALQAGVDYADLLSEPTESQREAAQDAGITAISGLGASPGLTNVLVSHAAEEFDELQEAHISWVSLRTIAQSPGLLETILWELSDDRPTRQYFQNGRFEAAAPFEGSRLVKFPAPVGRQTVYFVPHTEVKTLPRHFPSLRFCAVRGGWRAELMDDLSVLQRYGFLNASSIQHTKRIIWERFGQRDSQPWMLYLHVEVVGVRGAELVRRVYKASHPAEWGHRGGARMTGVPASVGAQLLARHGRKSPGFVDPEEYYDPHEFLQELGRRNGIHVGWNEQEIADLATVPVGPERSE